MRRVLIFVFLLMATGLVACGAQKRVTELTATTVAENFESAETAAVQASVLETVVAPTNTPPATTIPTPPSTVAPPEGWIALEGAPMPPVAPLGYEWWGGMGFTPFFDPNLVVVVFFYDPNEGSDRYLVWNGGWNYSASFQTFDVWTFQKGAKINALEVWALQYLDFVEKTRPPGWQTPRLLEGGDQGVENGGSSGHEGGGAGTP